MKICRNVGPSVLIITPSSLLTVLIIEFHKNSLREISRGSNTVTTLLFHCPAFIHTIIPEFAVWPNLVQLALTLPGDEIWYLDYLLEGAPNLQTLSLTFEPPNRDRQDSTLDFSEFKRPDRTLTSLKNLELSLAGGQPQSYIEQFMTSFQGNLTTLKFKSDTPCTSCEGLEGLEILILDGEPLYLERFTPSITNLKALAIYTKDPTNFSIAYHKLGRLVPQLPILVYFRENESTRTTSNDIAASKGVFLNPKFRIVMVSFSL